MNKPLVSRGLMPEDDRSKVVDRGSKPNDDLPGRLASMKGRRHMTTGRFGRLKTEDDWSVWRVENKR